MSYAETKILEDSLRRELAIFFIVRRHEPLGEKRRVFGLTLNVSQMTIQSKDGTHWEAMGPLEDGCWHETLWSTETMP